MTFIHEGNRTLAENLINFEKMVSGGRWLPRGPSLRALLCPLPRGCRAVALGQPPGSQRGPGVVTAMAGTEFLGIQMGPGGSR